MEDRRVVCAPSPLPEMRREAESCPTSWPGVSLLFTQSLERLGKMKQNASAESWMCRVRGGNQWEEPCIRASVTSVSASVNPAMVGTQDWDMGLLFFSFSFWCFLSVVL